MRQKSLKEKIDYLPTIATLFRNALAIGRTNSHSAIATEESFRLSFLLFFNM